MYPQREHPLLRRARALAMEQQRQVDTLHLLVIALTDHEAAGHARFAIREVLSDEHCGALAEQTNAYILAQIKQQSIPNTPPELTPELESVMRSCTQEAASRERSVTAAALLLTMLTQDAHLSRWVQAQRVPVERLVTELRLVVDQPDTYANIDEHDGALAAAERNRERDRLAETFLGEYVKPIDTTPRLPYATLNVPRLNAVLQTLATSATGVGGMDVTVCVSTPGSVLALLARVLADRVALRDTYPATQSALRAIREVRIISLSSLLRGAAVDANVDPTRILRAAKREAAKNGALLIVDHVEALVPQSPTTAKPGSTVNARPPHQGTTTTAPPEHASRTRGREPGAVGWARTPATLDPPTEPRGFTEEELRKLATEFTSQGRGLVLGHFYCDTEKAVRELELPATFEQGGVKVMRIMPFDRAETIFLIDTFYLPLWLREGYEVKRGAFDRVYDLAPYVWNGRQRPSLPMLAINLARDAQETADQGTPAADNIIEAALHALPRRQTLAASTPGASKAKGTEAQQTATGQQVGGQQVGDAPRPAHPPTEPALVDALKAAHKDILALKAYLHPSGWSAQRARLIARIKRTTKKARFEEQRRYLRTLPSGLLVAQLLADADYELYPDGEQPPGWRSGLYHPRLEDDGDSGGEENTHQGGNNGTPGPSGGTSGNNSGGQHAKDASTDHATATEVAHKAQELNNPTGENTPGGSTETQASAPPSVSERGTRAPTSTRLTAPRLPDMPIFPSDHRRRTHD